MASSGDVKVSLDVPATRSRPAYVPPPAGAGPIVTIGTISLLIITFMITAVSFATLGVVIDLKNDMDDLAMGGVSATAPGTTIEIHGATTSVSGDTVASGEATTTTAVPMPVATEPSIHLGENVCLGAKPIHANPAAEDHYFDNTECLVNSVLDVLEQAGANVTEGYVGEIDARGAGREPITEPYWQMGLCPVNVHWHLGAEHLSVGEFDSYGSGPAHDSHRKLLASSEETREGFLCHKYDPTDYTHTTPYDWKHCVDMVVGQTYEVHWPHSAAGACGTPNQYQTPFYDGVFCTGGIISLDPLNTYEKIGVQSQVFTIVNDENYYYPDLIRGMIVDGDYGYDVAKYTGSTTGTSRDNEICSRYTPITWQVDRKCHIISASSFDKMCADMKAQRDDMTDDLYAHGARELVADHLAANNLQTK